MTTIEKLKDLLLQATTERSHHYVAAVCQEAIHEIKRLQLEVDRLSEYKWMYEGLNK